MPELEILKINLGLLSQFSDEMWRACKLS